MSLWEKTIAKQSTVSWKEKQENKHLIHFFPGVVQYWQGGLNSSSSLSPVLAHFPFYHLTVSCRNDVWLGVVGELWSSWFRCVQHSPAWESLWFTKCLLCAGHSPRVLVQCGYIVSFNSYNSSKDSGIITPTWGSEKMDHPRSWLVSGGALNRSPWCPGLDSSPLPSPPSPSLRTAPPPPALWLTENLRM